MIKIRLHGTIEDIEAASFVIRNQFHVLSITKPYKDRGENEYYRVYVDCEVKTDGKIDME